MINLELLSTRELQIECARALSTLETTNNNIHQFNAKAHNNSQIWYKVVIEWYISQYGDLPSKKGPGTEVKLILDKNV
jgi:hypothetical protein